MIVDEDTDRTPVTSLLETKFCLLLLFDISAVIRIVFFGKMKVLRKRYDDLKNNQRNLQEELKSGPSSKFNLWSENKQFVSVWIKNRRP